MTEQPAGYLSYLLRLWRTGRGDRVFWRASLESPMTGERLGFASLEKLFAFLAIQVEEVDQRAADHDAEQERGIDDE